MDLFERRGFGRVDLSTFGLWLNIDPVLNSPLGPDLTSLTLSSFHFPLNEDHSEFAERTTSEHLGFVLNCFTMFIHERRHFHDLLATPYGSVLMRQYTRASLITQAYRHDLYFREPAIVVPLADWIANESIFELAYGVKGPGEGLRQLHETYSNMQQKLEIYNSGTVSLPEPFDSVDATSILEGLAILTQQNAIESCFGPDSITRFREAFDAPHVEKKYYGAIALCAATLGRDAPQEIVAYCLLASLCGNFQDPELERPRCPVDLLVGLLMWLRRRNFVTLAIGDFEEFRLLVDCFFEEIYGDDVQGMVMQAAKANAEVSDTYKEMVEKQAAAFGDDDGPKQQLEVFENFRSVQAAFAANVTMNPLWYVGSKYGEVADGLPSPVLFLECETPFPIDEQIEELYYVQTESRLNVATLPPELKDRAEPHVDAEGVLRGAHILSPRVNRFSGATSEYPMHFSFEVPKVDVELWQRSFDSNGVLVRFLHGHGPKTMSVALYQQVLMVLGLVGTRVYSVTGEAAMPPIPKDPSEVAIDPEIRKVIGDDSVSNSLRELRRIKSEIE